MFVEAFVEALEASGQLHRIELEEAAAKAISARQRSPSGGRSSRASVMSRSAGAVSSVGHVAGVPSAAAAQTSPQTWRRPSGTRTSWPGARGSALQ
jgi:hypothetical protein